MSSGEGIGYNASQCRVADDGGDVTLYRRIFPRLVSPVAFYPLEKLHVLAEGYRRVFRVAGRVLLLLEQDGERYLLDNRCPHAGHPLQEATVTGACLRCPLHGIEFSLQHGRAVNSEVLAPGQELVFYQLVYRDDVVGVDL